MTLPVSLWRQPSSSELSGLPVPGRGEVRSWRTFDRHRIFALTSRTPFSYPHRGGMHYWLGRPCRHMARNSSPYMTSEELTLRFERRSN